MDRTELVTHLESAGVDSDAYGINTTKNEAYCLVGRPGFWSVFYSERGLRTGYREFVDEDTACRAFLDLVLSDPTVFRQPRSGPRPRDPQPPIAQVGAVNPVTDPASGPKCPR